MRNRFSAFLFPLLFVAGLAVLLYPTISDRWNRYTQSRAIVDYTARVETMERKDFSKMIRDAAAYNAALRNISFPLMYADRVAGYTDLLSVEDSDVMGVVSISKIGVELPIYHGTSDAVLNVGVGHLQGTSLPIGGADTHAVLSAHRGLPSAKLFTDLDRMAVGDTFELHILDQTLTYRVESCSVVLPDKVDALYVQQGRDLCTLMTCTPYGINTHRLLVCGVRMEAIQAAEHEVPIQANQAEARPIPNPLAGILLAVPAMLVILFAVLLIHGIRNLIRKGGEDRVVLQKV